MQNDKCPVCCRRTSGFKVVLGAHSLSNAEDTEQTFEATAVYNHPDFSISNYDNDIALLKVYTVIRSCSWKSLKSVHVYIKENSFHQQTVRIIEYTVRCCFWQLDKPITESDAVNPVKFQRESSSDPKESDIVETAGWGSLNNLGGRPDKLQELTIKVMQQWLCGRGDYYGTKFTSNMLCAADRRKDTCDVSSLQLFIKHFKMNMTTVKTTSNTWPFSFLLSFGLIGWLRRSSLIQGHCCGYNF